MTEIPLFKPYVHEKAQEAVVRVLRSGWIGLGPETKAFEEEFAKYIGCDHAIATNSGTEALRLAVAYWKPKNKKIITTPNTFVATNHVLVQAGYTPIFADIDPDTGNLDLNSVRKLCKKYHPGGLMVVHYGGLANDMDAIKSLSIEFGLKVIEDAAHAAGSRVKGIKIGNTGFDTCFSFHAVKNLNIGDGGMVTTNNHDFAQFCHNMRWFGIDKTTISRALGSHYSWEYNVTDFGYKSHMNDIAAAIGRVQLERLPINNVIRRNADRMYRERLQAFTIRFMKRDDESSHHLMVIRSKKKKEIIKALTAANIGYGYHYKPNYLYEIYKTYPKDSCKGMEEFYKTAISLPMHLFLTQWNIAYICDVINSAVRR